MCLTFDGNLTLGHGFQQGTLGLWRSTVDFIGKHQFRKNRTGMKFKFLLVAAVNGYTENIRRQKIAGKLNALVTNTNHGCQCMRQGRLSNTG